MKRYSLFLIILSISLISILSQGCDKDKGGTTPTEPTLPSGGLVTSISASVEPSSYYGPCPKTFVFTGIITVNGPATVTYRWEHSPGTGFQETVYFWGAGSAEVTKEYTVDHSDFLALIIDAPNTTYNGEYLYALAGFTVTCGEIELMPEPEPIPIPIPGPPPVR